MNIKDYFKGDELAASVWESKYKAEGEQTPDDMHRRMAKEYYRAEQRYIEKENIIPDYVLEKLSKYGKNREDLTEHAIYNLFKGFKYVVPQGSIMATLGTDKLASLSNCSTIKSPEDSYSAIMYADTQTVSLYKRRYGVGLDISKLRPNSVVVKNAAVSSTGAVSFMDRFSHSAREAAQGGRRAALMLTLDIRHPDSLEFIQKKRDTTSVTGANISLKITDDFMRAVESDSNFVLRFPIDAHLSLEKYNEWYPGWDNGELNYIPKDDVYVKVIQAKKYWDEIIKSARDYAEPGVIFMGPMVDHAPDGVYDEYRMETTNPCFTGDMNILTTDGYKTFESLEGREIELVNAYGKAVKGKVWCSGEKEVIKITLSRDAKRTCLCDENCEEGEVCYQNMPVGVTTISPIKKGEIKCTYNHEFMLVTQEPSYAFDLEGKYLMPYHTRGTVYVEKIEKIGKEKVYDFTLIEDTHWGVVEGVIAHNCSEIGMKEDSCRLMVVNLLSFVKHPYTEDAYFDFDEFYKVNYESMRLMDDLVDLEYEYVQRIIDKILADPEPMAIKQIELDTLIQLRDKGVQGRRTGLGIVALADTLAALGLKYTEADNYIEAIFTIKMASELDATTDMALTRGPFTGWDPSKEYSGEVGLNSWFEFVARTFPEKAERMRKHGRRNVSFSTVSPTGSVSLLTQTSSGLEPVFQIYYTRRKKINPNDTDARVDFVDESGDKWQEYFVMHPEFVKWVLLNRGKLDMRRFEECRSWLEDKPKEELEELFKASPWYGSTAPEINWQDRVKLQGLLQLFTTHSLSSTVNLPKTVTYQEVSDIYMSAWKHNLKGITVYVEGSRSGVLVNKTEEFPKNVAPKRPKKLDAKVLRFQNNKEKWIAFVGLYNGHPYEIFTGPLGDLDIAEEDGFILKKKEQGASKFFYGDVEISSIFDPVYWNYAKLISGILRHGMSLPNVISTIEGLKLDNSHLNTWSMGVIRALKKFLTIPTDRKCDQCGDPDGLIYEEGCLKCKSCGNNKCG
jgi:ribonucleotide reductase alpha subunit